MADEEKDQSQQTEEPTEKRIEDARKQGQVIFSREVSSCLLFVIFTIHILVSMPYMLQHTTVQLAPYITQVHNFEFYTDSDDVVRLGLGIISELITFLVFPMIMVIFVTFVSNIAQHGFLFSPEAFKFDLKKVSPLAGLKRVFSMRSVVELLKTIVKMVLVTVCVYLALHSSFKSIIFSYNLEMQGIMSILWSVISKTFITISILSAAIALLDFLYQRYEYYKNLRMTKQQVKDELKHTEGNPEVRSKLRAIRQERAQRRMMMSVPLANVIITNPTHYAVALKYDASSMPAPQIVAKGIDDIALKIIEVGREHRVPIMRNPPLARALYEVDIEEYVPYEYYKAVAEIITKVMEI